MRIKIILLFYMLFSWAIGLFSQGNVGIGTQMPA
jgi:hypothetical protein